MRTFRSVLPIVLILSVAVLMPGCPKKDTETIPPAPDPVEREIATPPEDPPERFEVDPDPFGEVEPEVVEIDDNRSAAEWNRAGVLRTVFFGLDRFDLGELTKTTLRENAEWLKAHTDLDVVVQGHCDERGSIEYNLALGERRANSVRDYLTSLGVPRSRIRIVTYGEERPANRGHAESAWSQNRRAEFELE